MPELTDIWTTFPWTMFDWASVPQIVMPVAFAAIALTLGDAAASASLVAGNVFGRHSVDERVDTVFT